MMSVEIEEKLGPARSLLVSGLDDEKRRRIAAAMGSEARQTIVEHLQELAASRHATAERLGAPPTGYIGQLAENFDQSSTVTVDEDGVSISMQHPVIARALRDITILPSKQYLTIPLNALAYGHRAGEFDKVRLIKQGSGGGSGKKKPVEIDNSVPAFLLVRSVTQRRDPTLLPTFDELANAAALGAKREIRALLSEPS